MTQFAANDFAYIAAKQKQLADDDMDAANEPVTTAENTPSMREWLVCVMCNHKWHGLEAKDDCPACNVKNPTIPF